MWGKTILSDIGAVHTTASEIIPAVPAQEERGFQILLTVRSFSELDTFFFNLLDLFVIKWSKIILYSFTGPVRANKGGDFVGLFVT